ncbi:hypothetical protein EJ04DRAFT_304277 [Polyplosphaeria fusca]|uniref:Uncharacterized protein n=1 Tax=Polyplosphaeria fusca TaxID=682080 RepID=A0A9P4QXI1_9PLEO|nr:hypothetical protein EJ04DRAFT_304277 [Polyplosphaeria fusca]
MIHALQCWILFSLRANRSRPPRLISQIAILPALTRSDTSSYTVVLTSSKISPSDTSNSTIPTASSVSIPHRSIVNTITMHA